MSRKLKRKGTIKVLSMKESRQMAEVTPAAVKPAVAAAKPVVTPAAVAPAKVEAAKEAVAGAPAKPAEAKEKKERKGRASALNAKKIFLVEAKIREKMPEGRTVLNPKREGSNGFRAFALYSNGMTVEAFVKIAGETLHEGKPVGSLADVRWDADHGFIELKD